MAELAIRFYREEYQQSEYFREGVEVSDAGHGRRCPVYS